MIETGGEKQVPFSWHFFLLKSKDRNVLIDSGACNPQKIHDFKVGQYQHPLSLLAKLNLTPDDISNIYLTHHHFDHAGCIQFFPNAKIHATPETLKQLNILQTSSPTTKQSQFSFQIIPSRGHTNGSAAFLLRLQDEKWLFTGDECYFREHCIKQIPLSQISRTSQEENIAFLKLASKESTAGTGLLTMHDPIYAEKYPEVKPGIYQIYP